MKNLFIIAASLLFFLNAPAQKKIVTGTNPKLVVGIVVDQMRWDYLYRYADRYSANGFRRLLNEGFTCENTFIPYTPTYTAAGHASIFTGSVPALNGIMGNNWYNRELNRTVYCTEDTLVTSVGSTSDAGKMSPDNLWTTTVTDELRIATNFRSKVVGIALKDRGAILPAGHSANAAYWFDDANGSFITSTFYMPELPGWVKQFNNKKLTDQYLKQNWNVLYPINSYNQSTPDEQIFEGNFPSGSTTFPHLTEGITKGKYNALRYTPYGNTLTMEMAKAAIEGESLGQAGNTDFLTVSFSSTDYIGHTFGPNSVEIEDCYLRLDNDLASFFNYLDGKIGKGQYTVFLTADHGAAIVPAYLIEHKTHGGAMSDIAIETSLNKLLSSRFNIKNGIDQVINYQVYLNKDIGIEDQPKVKEAIIEHLLTYPAIVRAIDLKQLSAAAMPEKLKTMLTNGYNQKLSGDIQFIFKPHWFDGGTKGTTHGSWNPYDSHIPLVWYGWGVNKGKTNRETYMTDISATVSALLRIQMPSGCVGKVIEEAIQ